MATLVEVEDGHVQISSTPGAGVEWNEEAVEQYAVTL